jgi:hypothetical protein
MKVKSNVKAGDCPVQTNHNEKMLIEKSKGLTVKAGVKAGALTGNHNDKIVIDKQTKSFTVKSGVKAGALTGNHNEKMENDNNNSTEQK